MNSQVSYKEGFWKPTILAPVPLISYGQNKKSNGHPFMARDSEKYFLIREHYGSTKIWYSISMEEGGNRH